MLYSHLNNINVFFVCSSQKKRLEKKRLEEELEKKRLEELEKKRLEELEKKRLEELEKKRLEELEKKRLEELEKKRLEELEKKRLEELEKKRLAEELEKKRLEEELEKKRLEEELEKKRLAEEAERREEELRRNTPSQQVVTIFNSIQQVFVQMQKCISDYISSQSQIDPFSRLLVTPIDAYKPKKMYLPEYVADYRAFIRVYIEKLRTLLDNQLKLNNPLQNLIDLFRQTLEKQLSALIYVKYEVDLNYIIDNIPEQQSQLYFLLYDSYNDQKVLQLVKQNQITSAKIPQAFQKSCQLNRSRKETKDWAPQKVSSNSIEAFRTPLKYAAISKDTKLFRKCMKEKFQKWTYTQLNDGYVLF
ncbi:signal_recognition particle-docking protein [Hexamita inflata]|uniref:Signal_recognition particle-docking protein n=1 Tax=Hexamita inflata TaxID=28002 RepID=A0ABP1HRQ1_9EUKA